MTPTPMPLDTDADLDLHAYLDGELDPDQAAEVEARLLADPEAAARYEAYRRHRELIGEAAQVTASPWTDLRTEALRRELAARLRRASEASGARGRPASAWDRALAPMRAAAVTFLVVGAAVGGWQGHSYLAGGGGALPEYVLEAVGAHQVFATDEVRPVEFTAEASPEALAWVSAKLGRSLSIPDLEPLGIQLVGTRLLGTKEGPLAQFLYEDGGGQRLTVTVGPHPEDQPVEDLQVASVALVDGVVGYWREPDLDYVLVAESDSVQIETIASRIGRTPSS